MKRLTAAMAAALLTVGLTAGCTFNPPNNPCPTVTTTETTTPTEAPKPVTYIKATKTPAPTKTVTVRPHHYDDHYCGDD